MESNMTLTGPVNFFIGGGRYISDNFNMQIIDTANPNAFENLTLNSVLPDMMESYIQSEKTPQQPPVPDNKNVSILGAIKSFFSAPADAEQT